jgi:hypothetical protein
MMLKDELHIISEGESLSFKDWCRKLSITDLEFDELLSYRIFLQIESNLFRNTFVGTIKLKKNLFYSLPKCFSVGSNSDEKIVKQTVQVVERSLLNYKKRVDNSKAIRTEENFYLAIRFLKTRTEFDLLLTLKESYFKSGLFRKKKNTYHERRTFGGVNWQQTISKRQPIYSNGSLVYVDTISKILSFEENKITILHLSILSYLAKKYHFFEYSGNLSATLKAENLEYLSEIELRRDSVNWISILNSELRKTFQDELKEILLLLREFFVEDGYKSTKAFSLFGTSYYYMVWEDALKVVMTDEYRKFISQFGQPTYYLKNGISSDNRQEPDILIERGNSFYILDAKYYILQRSKPGWKDIVKQLFYHKTFVPQKNYLTVQNIFLVPLLQRMEPLEIEKDDEYLGRVVIELSGNALPKFPEIEILGLNPVKVLQNYVRAFPEQIKFTNLLPPN